MDDLVKKLPPLPGPTVRRYAYRSVDGDGPARHPLRRGSDAKPSKPTPEIVARPAPRQQSSPTTSSQTSQEAVGVVIFRLRRKERPQS